MSCFAATRDDKYFTLTQIAFSVVYLIQEGIERFGHRIHGFCLMPNHIHLAWQEGEEKLSGAVQNLAFRYAQRVNRFRKEIGHFFQGRFKSILVNKKSYLTRLVRYIHLK